MGKGRRALTAGRGAAASRTQVWCQRQHPRLPSWWARFESGHLLHPGPSGSGRSAGRSAAWSARLVRDEEAPGSNPGDQTNAPAPGEGSGVSNSSKATKCAAGMWPRCQRVQVPSMRPPGAAVGPRAQDGGTRTLGQPPTFNADKGEHPGDRELNGPCMSPTQHLERRQRGDATRLEPGGRQRLGGSTPSLSASAASGRSPWWLNPNGAGPACDAGVSRFDSGRSPHCGCSSAGRAPPCQGGGHGIEARHPLRCRTHARARRTQHPCRVGHHQTDEPAPAATAGTGSCRWLTTRDWSRPGVGHHSGPVGAGIGTWPCRRFPAVPVP